MNRLFQQHALAFNIELGLSQGFCNGLERARLRYCPTWNGERRSQKDPTGRKDHGLPSE
jgi:hypothetical protein